jgi:hypothetical protein
MFLNRNLKKRSLHLVYGKLNTKFEQLQHHKSMFETNNGVQHKFICSTS